MSSPVWWETETNKVPFPIYLFLEFSTKKSLNGKFIFCSSNETTRLYFNLDFTKICGGVVIPEVPRKVKLNGKFIFYSSNEPTRLYFNLDFTKICGGIVIPEVPRKVKLRLFVPQ